MTALLGTFVSIKTMADGSPRIILDLQCTLADVAALGLMPGVAFGIARITGESSIGQGDGQEQTRMDAHSSPISEGKTSDPLANPKQRAGELCIMACTFCKDPTFWAWLEVESEAEAKQAILDECRITSRKELDTSEYAGRVFMAEIRAPFMAWRAAQ